ncbi:MAG TPA: HlyD family efflux transporter periplasmic adaptor subunit, partial [Chitinophagales bacterium]|nr:HlyD family efflux transporter periplasmic adaptor subunit [Chitinophagales bacterium]
MKKKQASPPLSAMGGRDVSSELPVISGISGLLADKLMVYACLAMLFLVTSCSRNENTSDAYGNFEATEIIVSSEGNGKLLSFQIEEGQQLQENQVVGYIDTLQLYLKKMQLLANRKSIASKTGGIIAQIDVLQSQKQTALREKDRFEKLVAQKAAAQKQLDDINSQITILDAQIKSIETQHAPLVSEVSALDFQIRQLDDQLRKCVIVNPVNGTVLAKYAQQNELTAIGRPLYKIANLDTMTLRVYISGAQLPQVKIGQEVKVLVDGRQQELDTLSGTLSWIASNAEFTPKTIQTREERVNLVYAVKVLVKNNGQLKIGMPGEIQWT